jgi:hypothetical protein
LGVVEDEEGCLGDFGGFWGLGGDWGFEEEGEDGGDRGVDRVAIENDDLLNFSIHLPRVVSYMFMKAFTGLHLERSCGT